ncbi:hypothetical protein ACPEIC_35800 [Stenotrophomonas sp. NPDC087984]
MKKRTCASLGSVGAAAVLFVTASAASANWSSHIDSTEVGAGAAWDCPSQSICFYGGSRGCVNGGAPGAKNPGAKKSFAAAQRVLSHTTTGSGCEI